MTGGRYDRQPEESLEQWRDRLNAVDVNRLGGNAGALFLTEARRRVAKLLAATPVSAPIAEVEVEETEAKPKKVRKKKI